MKERHLWTPIMLIIWSLAVSSTVSAGDKESAEKSGDKAQISTIFRNGLKQGKLEAAMLMNKHVSIFDIDTQVQENTATLSGTVKSGVEKDIAEQLALGIEGIENVDNQIKVDPKAETKKASDKQGTLVKALSDAKITVAIESKLAINQNLSAMGIDVETNDQSVILKGKVATEGHRELAELIARNTSGVKKVENKLEVN